MPVTLGGDHAVPIPILRALLTGEKLTPGWRPQWKFLAETNLAPGK